MAGPHDEDLVIGKTACIDCPESDADGKLIAAVVVVGKKCFVPTSANDDDSMHMKSCPDVDLSLPVSVNS